MNDTAIHVEGLSKRYEIGAVLRRRNDNLRERIVDGFKGMLRRNGPATPGRDTIWALKDISFEVKQGEVLGIIGRNGAGKSTLLKILSRITQPTSGRAEIRGRVGSLLEVGIGFHPELTGRENIYLNGAILGMKRAEISRKFDEIVSFAEIERFIDTPVKRYSSGMYVRLAFAVAAYLEPEVLLVDEVLAVGDVRFQKKCLGKMGDIASQGRTVLFVSHNISAILQLTESSLLLSEGEIVARGLSDAVIKRYLDASMDESITMYNVADKPRRYRDLARQVEFVTLEFENSPTTLVPADAEIDVLVTVRGNESVDAFRFSMTILRVDGSPVGNLFGPEILSVSKGVAATFKVTLADLGLAPGRYFCNVAVGTGNHLKGRVEFDIVHDVLHFEVMAPVGVDGVMAEWNRAWGAIRFKEPRVVRIN